jgi:DNA-binding MarR family transcriptional regulator
MITVPPLLHQLVVNNKIDPMATKVYRFLKLNDFNDEEPNLGRLLSDLEMDYNTFNSLVKALEEYGFIERVKRPGKTSKYNIKKYDISY